MCVCTEQNITEDTRSNFLGQLYKPFTKSVACYFSRGLRTICRFFFLMLTYTTKENKCKNQYLLYL